MNKTERKAMTVGQLLQKLSGLNPELPLFIELIGINHLNDFMLEFPNDDMTIEAYSDRVIVTTYDHPLSPADVEQMILNTRNHLATQATPINPLDHEQTK